MTAPDATRECRRFRLRSDPDAPSVFRFSRRWSRHFTDHGAGRYRVSFRRQGNTLGPGVAFRRL